MSRDGAIAIYTRLAQLEDALAYVQAGPALRRPWFSAGKYYMIFPVHLRKPKPTSAGWKPPRRSGPYENSVEILRSGDINVPMRLIRKCFRSGRKARWFTDRSLRYTSLSFTIKEENRPSEATRLRKEALGRQHAERARRTVHFL